MTERKAIRKKDRFEIFKRDSFTCQYCGKSAPDVILEIDHIKPVSKGGDNELENLITSCQDCNAGKRDRELSDSAVLIKRKSQLNELQKRREQLKMMLDWQNGLKQIEEESIQALINFWNESVIPFSLNEYGISKIRDYSKKFSTQEILDGMRVSIAQYVKYENGIPTIESVCKACDYIPRICSVTRRTKNTPYLRDLYYIRGIVRKRMYCNEWKATELLEIAFKAGHETEELKDIACNARNWTEWRTMMENL